jgi:phage recombination protein Bet|tara:strand:- start:1 stop:921 length:921 start_codon:yes stop_codon:yes gene_type:complete
MTKEITTYKNITPAQVDLIKSQIAVGATDDELKLFLHVADKSGLDPLSRQIYFIKRSGKMTIQTGIDGFRAVADRTGQYVGSSDPVFEDNGKIPAKATVTVNKVVGGIVGNFTATARWEEYYPGKSQGFMWDKMPHTMLGKCAEALALRKAFPAQLSGLYTGDEMDQAGDQGIPNNTKNINPKGGSKQLEETLTEPVVEEPPEEEDSSNRFEDAQSILDEAFAFCENKEIHDSVINNLNDIKWEMSEANKQVLVNFAQTYPANRERFQTVAKEESMRWKKYLNPEDWNRLTDYMGELNTFFDMEEE